MRKNQLLVLLLLVTTAVFWAVTDTRWLPGHNPHQLRAAVVQLTGILALVCMSFGALISTRPRWLEPAFGGLDKMYLIHKWLGIATLVFCTIHWWYAMGAQMILGWTFNGSHVPSPVQGMVESLLHLLRKPAHIIGEWSFYALAVLILIALWRRIPYRIFALSHIAMTVVFALLLFHAVVLTRLAYWSEPFGILVGTVVAIGSVCTVVIAFRRLGKGHEIVGTVEQQTYYPELKVLETEVRIASNWPGHKAGQFAFAKTSLIEGSHPFTIASDWHRSEGKLTFMAKELGDFTSRLRTEFAVGRNIRLEGPYGCFDFEDGKRIQIWVAAGIGITPFLARMRQLARNGHAMEIHLFYVASDTSGDVLSLVRDNARTAEVKLRIHLTQQHGRLDGDVIRELLPKWRRASVWFCGPFAFGDSLRRGFVDNGLEARHFHQERFEFR